MDRWSDEGVDAMAMAAIVLFIIALICFALAAVSIAHPRINLIGLGLFCVTLALLLQSASVTIAPK